MEEKYCNYIIAKDIAEQIQKIQNVKPRIAIVLGSGWGGVADAMQNVCKISYSALRGMPQCGVEGHAGNFVFGDLNGIGVVLQQGRIHMYEGHSARQTVLPMAIMKELGVDKIILTNAAGGINPTYNVGDLMILSDHINYTGRNPLEGVKPTIMYPVFVDMTHVYDQIMNNAIADICRGLGIKANKGTYMQVLGPSFETPAEVRAYSTLGADAVGMSTAIEAVFARYLKMRVVGLSCITNKAAGLFSGEIEHSDVIEQSKKREGIFAELLCRVAVRCAQEE